MRRARGAGVRPAKLVLVVGLLAGGLVVALAQNYGDDPPAPPAAAAAATAVGASIGVYTTEQADRGAGVFAARCSGCHGGALEGGFGPRLAPLGAHWRGQTLGSLFRFVSSNMPYDSPGSLEMDQYLDVVSFVLSSNGYPAGESPLVADAAVIDPVLLDDPPPAP